MTTDDESQRTSALLLAGEYLRDSRLLQVATAGITSMGFAHVWFASDDEMRLYFASNVAKNHSQHIRETSRVSFGTVSIDLVGLGQKVRGITGIGRAAELYGQDLERGYAVYSEKWPQANDHFSLSDITGGASPMRIYCITPSELVLWDEVNFPTSPRQRVI